MAKCAVCGKTSRFISKALKLCLECIRENNEKASPFINEAHAKSRESFGLPVKAPKDLNGIPCKIGTFSLNFMSCDKNHSFLRNLAV